MLVSKDIPHGLFDVGIQYIDRRLKLPLDELSVKDNKSDRASF